jgi:hypothetical protein
VVGADLHLNQVMDWLALLFNMRGTHQLRSAFEEGALARQSIRLSLQKFFGTI